MKIFQTNGGLGYMQLAFIIRLEKSQNGYNYLCIGTHNIDSDNTMYQIGEIVEDLEDIYIEETTYKLTDSPLNGTYLFEYFINNYKIII